MPSAATSPEDHRRLRRMISNRASARRSRMRKQQHLDHLRAQLTRLHFENRHLAIRIGAVAQRCLLVRRENDRISSESAALRQRLSEIRRFAVFRQLQRLSSPAAACGVLASGNEQILASLIA